MDLLEQYLHDCAVRGRTLRTVQSYKSSVKDYLDFFPDPQDVTKQDLVGYIEHLQKRGKKPSTIQRDFSAISGLYEYMRFMDLCTNNPILQVRSRYLDQSYEPERRFIPELEDVRKLVRAIEDDQDDMIRELAMVCLLAKTASRRGEYLELKDAT